MPGIFPGISLSIDMQCPNCGTQMRASTANQTWSSAQIRAVACYNTSCFASGGVIMVDMTNGVIIYTDHLYDHDPATGIWTRLYPVLADKDGNQRWPKQSVKPTA